ncbi:hypothetical protein MHZ92_08805 [Sporosarcina sp. ACRSL]|uniref:hypothetical protein n=1 Tax=Sporosarcina sp. ACRSL TaxID=2918215 RepID=UPI001EF571FA|nr:hypothetical protein [Sporosarcina sp. ACRSL]MCG7344231.1 hypothetical protein [Sporosarcina sp. ACRSL]
MFKDVLDIYNRNLLDILFLMVLVILPVTSLIFLAIIYFGIEFDGELSVFFVGYSIIINFIICLPPFLWLTLKDLNDEKAGLKKCLAFFATQFGPLLFTTFLFYSIAIYTSWMMLVPTIIILLFTMIYPFFSDFPTLKEMFIQAKNKIFEENIAIVVDLIIITSTLVLLWAGMTYFMQNFDNNIISFMLIRSLLNMVIFPFLYIYLTLRYRDTEEEFTMINV